MLKALGDSLSSAFSLMLAAWAPELGVKKPLRKWILQSAFIQVAPEEASDIREQRQAILTLLFLYCWPVHSTTLLVVARRLYVSEW